MPDVPHPRLVEVLLKIQPNSWRSIIHIVRCSIHPKDLEVNLPFNLGRFVDGTLLVEEWRTIADHVSRHRKPTEEQQTKRRAYMKELMRRVRADRQRAQQ